MEKAGEFELSDEMGEEDVQFFERLLESPSVEALRVKCMVGFCDVPEQGNSIETV